MQDYAKEPVIHAGQFIPTPLVKKQLDMYVLEVECVLW